MRSRSVTKDTLLHIVLYQPEIPQNTGNIGRTCVALGAKLWLVRPVAFRLDDHPLRRAGLDYWEHLDWEAGENWEALTSRLDQRPFWFFSRRAMRDYTNAEFQRGDVLVFGSETQGLPSTLLDTAAPQSLRLPTLPLVRSLNVSNAVAVAAYEAHRQIEA